MNSTSRSFARPGENPASRHLDWDGCFNARDLGRIPLATGGETRWGAVVRTDSIDGLSAAGWSALEAHGVRTVIDLRNEDEHALDRARRPAGIDTLHLPLDAIDDSDFWEDWMHGPQFARPFYYAAHLERFPERSARVLTAIARAEPGGVLVHCVSGRDRTGQVSMLLLALPGSRRGTSPATTR
jgi:protein-tyrosine phosphatase